MIYKTYKITYENLSKIMDLSIFKTHLNIGKSFSFLIHCNIYAAEIESISLCDENSTKVFISGECENIVDVHDYNDHNIGEVYLPSIKKLESSGKIIETNFDYIKINSLLKIYMENVFKKMVVVNEAVIKRETVINRMQEVILDHQYDNKLLEIEGYNCLNDFFREITADIKNYSRVPERKNNISSEEKRSDKKEDLKQDSITKAALNHEETKSDNKARSTLKRLEYLKDNLKEINNK